jgi:hypothetical protein
MTWTPSAKAANAIAINLRLQGRLQALIRMGDYPKGAMRQCTSTLTSSTLSQPIAV